MTDRWIFSPSSSGLRRAGTRRLQVLVGIAAFGVGFAVFAFLAFGDEPNASDSEAWIFLIALALVLAGLVGYVGLSGVRINRDSEHVDLCRFGFVRSLPFDSIAGFSLPQPGLRLQMSARIELVAGDDARCPLLSSELFGTSRRLDNVLIEFESVGLPVRRPRRVDGW